MHCSHNAELIPDKREIEGKKDGVCPVAWAEQCIEIAYHNNCGKSVICRDGMTQIKSIVNDITGGKGQADDLEIIKDICTVICLSEGCELAVKTAENVLFSLSEYHDEWEKHCYRKRCSELVCKKYYSLYIAAEQCTGCGRCIEVCENSVIHGGKGLISVIDETKCNRCGKCMEVCENQAVAKYVSVKPHVPTEPVPVGSFSNTRRRRRKHG